MADELDFMTEEKWNEFREEMLRIVSRGHFRSNVPASPEDTVQSAIATYYRRRQIGEKRELMANTPETLRLVLLYRAWSKNKEHHRRATYQINRPAKFGDLDASGSLEASVRDRNGEAAETELFLKEVVGQMEQFPDQDRDVAHLCMEGYRERDIAQTLNLSVNQVKGILLALKIRLLGNEQ